MSGAADKRHSSSRPDEPEQGGLPPLDLTDPQEEELTPVSAYALQSDAGRQAFLHQFYWIGETSFFEAVAHVWSSLAEPRAARCTAMGIAAGTGGTGKKALAKVLKQFFEAAMAVDHPLADRADFDTLEEWNRVAMRAFELDKLAVQKLLEKYSIILNGGADVELAPPSPQLIYGPWKDKTTPF